MQEQSEYINDKKRLKFEVPAGATPEQQLLAADIITLDHRAYNRLKPNTREWAEVLGLLHEAAHMGLTNNHPEPARQLYERALETHLNHLQAKNRWRYLVGMVLGGFVAGFVANFILIVWGHVLRDATNLDEELQILISLFAGIGSVTSVLTRISSIDLKEDLSTPILVASAAFRPVAAIFLALVVFYVVDSDIVDIQFGEDSDDKEKRNGLFVVTSFLSGFSERFAADVISRVPFAK